MPESIRNRDVCCRKCGYCLKGLPRRGRCPECGHGYVADEPSVAEAISQFTTVIPKHWRLWLTPASTVAKRFPWVTIVVIAFCTVLLSTLFLAALVLATVLAACFPGPLDPKGDYSIYGVFVEIGWWGWRFRFYGRGALYFIVWFSTGQLLLSALIWLWYVKMSLSVKTHRVVVRRLGIYASACASAAILPPMIVVACWTYFNVRFPPRLWRETIGLRWLRISSWSYPQFRIDEAQVLCLLVLIPTIAAVAVAVCRMHRRCMESVGNALSGSYPMRESGDNDRDTRTETAPAREDT